MDEQSLDKVKLLRSGNDHPVVAKLEAMEWMSRYMNFIPPNNISAAAQAFTKEFMTAQPTQQRASLAELANHKAEPVYSIVGGI